jgi:prostaglandin-H2 D-isomerase / glutathione transferase
MTVSLTYFDFDGSRGLECRLALSAAGVAYEDIRVDRPTWMQLKPKMPYGALPVLQDGDRKLAQSNAILVYVGRQHGMHPTDAWQAAEHEAVMLSVEDLRTKMPGRPDMSEDDKRTARVEFANGWLKTWGDTLSARIVGPFLEGDSLNVADIKLAVILRSFLSGAYDHIPASTMDAWPKLLALGEAVNAHPGVVRYFASR